MNPPISDDVIRHETRRIVGHRPYPVALAEAQHAHARTPSLRDRIVSAVRIAS